MEIRRHASLAEAARTSLREGEHVLGGGTLVMREVAYRPQTVAVIHRIADPVLTEIRGEGDRIRIGARVTLARVMGHPDLASLAPVARAIGGPAIRNMGTVGGNLFAPPPYGDLACALLAAGAEAVWADGRTEPLEAMLASRGLRGILAAVRVPRLPPDELRFRKVTRVKPKGVAVMSLAAHMPRRGDRLGEVRLAWSNMGPRPLRGRAAEAALRGAALTPEGFAPALRACLDGLEPQDDALASAWYRREVAPVHLRRLLLGED